MSSYHIELLKLARVTEIRGVGVNLDGILPYWSRHKLCLGILVVACISEEFQK